jgi:phospholipid transport system substrate-binding protein
MRRFALLIVAAAALVAGLGSPAGAGEPDCRAKRFVELFGKRMVALVQSPHLAAEERRSRLRDLVLDSVDLERMGRFILGDYWNESSPEQRSEFQSLFTSFALGRFSDKLARERFEGFMVTGEDGLADSQALVHSRIETPQGEPLQWSWQVREADGHYRVVDLIVDGVSLANTYRAEIGSVASSFGVDGLLKILWIKSP